MSCSARFSGRAVIAFTRAMFSGRWPFAVSCATCSGEVLAQCTQDRERPVRSEVRERSTSRPHSHRTRTSHRPRASLPASASMTVHLPNTWPDSIGVRVPHGMQGATSARTMRTGSASGPLIRALTVPGKTEVITGHAQPAQHLAADPVQDAAGCFRCLAERAAARGYGAHSCLIACAPQRRKNSGVAFTSSAAT